MTPSSGSQSDRLILAAVDIGGTKVTASLSDRNGILGKVLQPTVKTGENTALPGQVDSMIDAVCGRAAVAREDIAALGISTCSPFERRDGQLVLVSPNICGGLAPNGRRLPNDWTEIPLEAELAPRYRRVAIDNDCITAATAERLFGAGKGEDNLLYVTWSTGIGAGAYVDGHLLLGKNRNALHLGHTYMNRDDTGQPLCGCGNFSHLEAYAAGPAIARQYAAAGGATATTAEVFELCRRGEAEARRIVEQAARIFARGLANAVALLDSRLIILGGSVANDWDVVDPLVREEFYRAFPPLTQEVEIRPSALERYLGDIAALSLVMPRGWIADWQKTQPWRDAPEAVRMEGKAL